MSLRARAYLIEKARRATLSLHERRPNRLRHHHQSFPPKSWLNNALSKPSDEPLDLTLSVLLTKLHLSAADVDADVHRHCADLASRATPVARELGLVSEQAAAVRTELAALLEEVGALEARSETSVGGLRDVLAIRERFASAAHALQQADRVAALVRTAEAAFARGDTSAAAGGVAQLGGALEALDAEQRRRLFPDAPARAKALREQLLERLRPELLQAVREHDSAAMLRLSSHFGGLGSASAVRDAYVQCAQGPLFEQWNAARRAPTASDALATLWRCVESLVPAERAFVNTVFKEDTALLPTLLGEALEAIGPQVKQTLLDALPTAATADEEGSGAASLPELWAEALRRAASIAEELGGMTADGVPRVVDALLLPFEPAQLRFATALVPTFTSRLPTIPPPPADASRRTVAHAASAVDRAADALSETLLAAANLSTDFGGPLGAEGTRELIGALVGAHAADLAAALPPLRPPPSKEAAADAEERTRGRPLGALNLVKAIHICASASSAPKPPSTTAVAARAREAAPLQTAAQRQAAAELPAFFLRPTAAGTLLPGP